MRKLVALCALLIALQTKAGWLSLHRIPKSDDVIKTYISGSPQSVLSSRNDNEESILKVAVWNMYKGKNKSWAKDFKELTDNSDFFIGQETFLNEKMENSFAKLTDSEVVSATSFFWKKKTRTGVATISKVQSNKRIYLKSRYREPIVRTPKVALITTYSLENGEELLIANIHAVNFVSSRKLMHQIRQISEEIINHQGPIIFAGDFNTWTKKKTRRLKRMLSSYGLKEITYPREEDNRMRFNGKVLDFIFYKGLELRESKVLGHIQGADHKPLTATFSY